MSNPMTNPETSNEYYGALNTRYDDRVAFLLAHGYTKKTVDQYNLAVYVNRGNSRASCIPAAKVMHCEGYAWQDIACHVI